MTYEDMKFHKARQLISLLEEKDKLEKQLELAKLKLETHSKQVEATRRTLEAMRDLTELMKG